MSRGWRPETLAAQALGRVDPRTGAIVPGIEPATTFLRDPDGGYRSGRSYARADNPTYEPAETLLTALERGAAIIEGALAVPAYRDYLVRSLRETFGLSGAPVRLLFSARPRGHSQPPPGAAPGAGARAGRRSARAD